MRIDYNKYINSKKWKDIRQELFLERGKVCEQCKSTKNIHVHHLHYDNFGCEKLEDLQILCKPCHMEKHPKYLKGRKYIKRRNTPETEKTILGDIIILTFTNINALRTPKGGVTKQMKELVWGKSKPPKGWINKCIGKEVSKSKYEVVFDLSKGYNKRQNKKTFISNTLFPQGVRKVKKDSNKS